jgi:hypothetical protein
MMDGSIRRRRVRGGARPGQRSRNDFEKGEADGTIVAMRLIAAAARAFRELNTAPPDRATVSSPTFSQIQSCLISGLPTELGSKR